MDTPDTPAPQATEDLRRLIPQDRTLRVRSFAELLRGILRGGS